MDIYKQFDDDLRSCKKCENILSECFVDPCKSIDSVKVKPIVSGIRQKPILLMGQAPGLTEYETGKPYQGQAGKKIREIFRGIGIEDFDSLVYSSAVVKCYPGRKYKTKDMPSSGSEDRAPVTEMIRNCRPLLEQQIDLVNPQIIVTLGSFPLKEYLRLSDQRTSKIKLDQYVEKSEAWDEKLIIFFPHTSGGARWLNITSNKKLFIKAQTLLRTALIDKDIINT